ncbi:MAG: ChaN family lipoprotein [Bacteroidales bacterium]|nr:ChaN family lipoprotein [Bacteroidales bacterium]
MHLLKHGFLLISVFFLHSMSLAQDKPAYRIFSRTGEPASYADMLQQAKEADIVLFGELHNNPIAHWLQYELSYDLHRAFDSLLVLGAEMFEADNQLILNEYLSGTILERHFRAEAKLWNNYHTDYRPLVEFAKSNGLSFIATNVPRRYAALVHRHGFEALETLSEEARAFLPPLPPPYDPELPGYKAMLEMEGMPAHGTENFPKAQAIKDATMGYFIVNNIPEKGLFIHFNGAYHSNNDEGIQWYIHQYAEKALRVMTISTVEQASVETLDEAHHGLANFIIAVPSTMTKTY